MPDYCIVETEDGWTIAERRDDENAIQTAERLGAVLIDAGPYQDYAEAQEAMIALQVELDDDETSDLPGNQPLEDRYDVD
jgi:hypothetical protein